MLASAETVAAPATTASLYFDPLLDHPPLSKPYRQPSFKKHKILPHPRNHRYPSTTTNLDRVPRSFSIGTAPIVSANGAPPSIGLEKETHGVRIPGPDLPPTPPAHSRTSSSTHSILPPSATDGQSPQRIVSPSPERTLPGTPPHQRSPPTPDVTPPQRERRPKALRPVLADRFPSKATTESRTESFKTARENPESSDDEKTTPRPTLSASRTSQSSVRRVTDPRHRRAQDIGLGLGLGLESDGIVTPRTKQEFFRFDGDWGSSSEVEQEWDDNLGRNVIVRKRRYDPTIDGPREEVVEDATDVTPTQATKVLRSMPLHERLQNRSTSSPLEFAGKGHRWTIPSISESSLSTDVRRSSGMSSKSTVSTVIEAILVDAPPQRQKTLRHVRKQTALRDSIYEISPPSSAATSILQSETTARLRPLKRHDGARSESLVSTSSVNSIASRKARRDVWRNGGVPVVVIPDRKGSVKANRPPSLRSSSSHRSKRSNSLASMPLSNRSKSKDPAPSLDQQSQRGRKTSESDGSHIGDQRTLDYPPVVPRRTSSLSAPTSRNNSRANSRAGSLTAESLKAHDALLGKKVDQQLPKVTVEPAPSSIKEIDNQSDQRQLEPAASVESHRDAIFDHKSLVDHNGDPFFGKRLTAHTTPFSQVSVDTNGTHSVADISEALAVNIYPHQNRSVLMVHHMSKPVELPNALRKEISAQTEDSAQTEKAPDNPKITASGPDGEPVTPPQPRFSLKDVDSPLRNPRAPPEPPAIQFIPATPSGLTPAAEKEKMLGNYFEETQGRPSLVRRALTIRRNSSNLVPRRPGLLARTLSLSKNTRTETSDRSITEKRQNLVPPQYPTAEDTPADETKLHPFWQPVSQFDVDDEYDEYYDDDRRGAPVDDRLSRPRRSLSDRVRRAFAILPIDDQDQYLPDDRASPERRTIKRTPSGNLRVMRRRRDSLGSLHWGFSHGQNEEEGRPSTAPNQPSRRVWGVEKRWDDRGRRLFPGWQDKLEQYRPQNLQRRLSEHRRQKRTEALRSKISGPREVRDGVGEVVKRNSYKGPSYQGASATLWTDNGGTFYDDD